MLSLEETIADKIAAYRRDQRRGPGCSLTIGNRWELQRRDPRIIRDRAPGLESSSTR